MEKVDEIKTIMENLSENIKILEQMNENSENTEQLNESDTFSIEERNEEDATKIKLEKTTKWKSSYDCSRRYKKKWELTYAWVRQASDGSQKCYCTVCHKNVTPKASSLACHERSVKHKTAAKNANFANAVINTQDVYVQLQEIDARPSYKKSDKQNAKPISFKILRQVVSIVLVIITIIILNML